MRELELHLLRLVPHSLRDDFMTVGVVVVEPGGEFAEVRFTRDWRRVECFAPDVEPEIFEHLERAIRGGLQQGRAREDLLRVVDEQFGELFELGPVKALLAKDPAAEMRVLERDYLAPMQAPEKARRTGRLNIVGRMEDAFAGAGVLELMQRDLDMREFTGESDPFAVDFGFRVGSTVKMFHALALNAGRDPAITLSYRFSKIRDGFTGRSESALLTAVIAEDILRARSELASGVAMLRENQIAVRGTGELDAIAAEVRRELHV